MTHAPLEVGPLEPLLADSGVTAIHIEEGAIRYEKAGVMYTSDFQFENDDQQWQVIERIVRAGGGTLSAHQPVVGCILADGTQVRAEYKPLSMLLRKAAPK